jgi:hypothetical protein
LRVPLCLAARIRALRAPTPAWRALAERFWRFLPLRGKRPVEDWSGEAVQMAAVAPWHSIRRPVKLDLRHLLLALLRGFQGGSGRVQSNPGQRSLDRIDTGGTVRLLTNC